MRGEFSTLRTELFELTVVPALAPHPVQMHRQLPSHRYLRDLPSPPHPQMEISAAPFRDAAGCNLGRFHQQEAQHGVSLLRDVAQPAPIPARLLQGTSPT